jgi:uncharacterized cupin superfamily protein
LAPDKGSTMSGTEISEALGRLPESADERERHPFDVEIQTVPPNTIVTYYHSHTEQWEFYHVLSGSGFVRDADGIAEIVPGDAFIFKPGEAHQISAGTVGLTMYVIANNPPNDHASIYTE